MHLALPVNIIWVLRLVAGGGAFSLLPAADQ
jgi:hypothetical protein